MKMLVRQTPLSTDLPFDLEELKEFIRVDQATEAEDTEVRNIGLAAAGEMEHLAQIALLQKTIRVTIFEPSLGDFLKLPIGPAEDTATPTMTVNGSAFSDFTFFGAIRPYLKFGCSFERLTPSWVQIEYQAGFENAASIPADLSYAIKDQAALLYDAKSPMGSALLSHSPHMARIAAKYRGVSL